MNKFKNGMTVGNLLSAIYLVYNLLLVYTKYFHIIVMHLFKRYVQHHLEARNIFLEGHEQGLPLPFSFPNVPK